MRSLILLLTLCISGSAQAGELANPNFLPFGEYEAFMGNAGIALDNSSGAVYYNPGALGFVTEQKVSVYGNAYAFNRININAPTALPGADFAISSNASTSVPLSSVTIFGSSRWTYAFSLNTVHSSQIDMTIPFRTSTSELQVSLSESESSLWIGPSVGRNVGDDFSLGLSLFAIRYTANTNAISYSRIDGTSFNRQSLSGTRETTNNWSGLLVFGGQWRIHHRWTAGARIQTASVNLRGRTDYFRSENTTGNNATFALQEEKNVVSQMKRPFQFGLGANYSPRPSLDLLLDVNFQLPAHYNSVPSWPAVNRKIDTKFTPRLNFGANWQATPTHRILGGFIYNPSAFSRKESYLDTEYREDFKGFTFGVQKDMGSLTSTIGGFYLWSRLRESFTSFRDGTEFSHRVVGLLLTASYRL